LLAELATEKDILICKLGYIHFPEAFYAYVGSTMNGIEARLTQHLRKGKKLHWHIDYLLSQSEVLEVILCPSEPFASCHSERSKESHQARGKFRVECFLAQILAEEFLCIPCLGASDCKCNSHLYFVDDKDRLRAKVVEAIDHSGLASVSYELEEWQSHSKRR
jgi:Uri superfamily endonuclease